MKDDFFQNHKILLDDAINAIEQRGYFSAYPEVPSGKIYGDTAKRDGLAAFEGYKNSTFELQQDSNGDTLGEERSPYGFKMNTQYPSVDLDVLFTTMQAGCVDWRNATIETRVGCALEIIHRLNRRSFEIGFSVMHTTGQGFMMAFQAGGPHAQDRGLEAVAYAYKAMKDCPHEVTWKKQVGKDDFVTLHKEFKIVPRGIGLVIGCSTFPTWNTYPGLFASLVTGNAVVVKPHPGAILPLAITVSVCQEVLQESGFDPHLVSLVTDTVEYGTKNMPKWNTISISGYHIREAGSTAVQELAFTLADGYAYADWAIERGLNIDDFAPRFSFFFNAHNDFFEEIAKYRAARRIWARDMKYKYGAKDSRSLTLRFHTQTAGCSLTAQQPEINIVRVAIQAMAGVLGGTQSLHTDSMDEALALPSEKAVQIALRTQQIIAHESGVANVADPLGGSYYLEWLTDDMERQARDYFDRIESLGGVVSAIEKGFFQKEIAAASYKYQQEIDNNERVVVGVNEYTSDGEPKLEKNPIKVLKN